MYKNQIFAPFIDVEIRWVFPTCPLNGIWNTPASSSQRCVKMIWIHLLPRCVIRIRCAPGDLVTIHWGIPWTIWERTISKYQTISWEGILVTIQQIHWIAAETPGTLDVETAAEIAGRNRSGIMTERYLLYLMTMPFILLEAFVENYTKEKYKFSLGI